ncbi:hypothetical protein QVD17_24829 [Tagetes erecta]|uniref:Protein LHY n=1 Tax=Tagetes erecta TaxID=13708 RepID=A0AAD8KIC1_TARER|nr:hypothetical protein QVD17_24829 [Tagetes erecta]
MEIPPPRPKRKPSYPYPRKIHTQEAEKPENLVSSLQIPDLERKPFSEKTSHTENLDIEKTSVEAQDGIEDPQEGPCAFVSLENEDSILNESYITIQARKHDGNKHTNINISLFESSHPEHENINRCQYSDNTVNVINDIQGKQTYPRHVPVQVVDVHQGVGAKSSVNIAEVSETSGQNHNNALKSSTIPPFHPLFTSFNDNEENYRSFLHVSSTMSSVIVSSLLQNPAAHAAASIAAKFWHPVNIEASSADSFSMDHLNSEITPPSMAAIAATTVAAATAWWSAHGLLPVCTPFYPGGYSCAFQGPIEENKVRVANTGREKAYSEGDLQEEKMYAEITESAADLSSSDEPEMKINIQGTGKTNVGKQIDRSSCGSNTTSSSELEMDILEKQEKETEAKGSDVKESISHTGRSTVNPNESWKGVSEEGRLAFQALFSREVLPQSFSDNPTVAEKDQQNINKNIALDLNRMSQEPGKSNGFAVLRGDKGILRMGLGSVKVNVHHTGFRPYKRCSIEAKESGKILSAESTGKAILLFISLKLKVF